MRVQLVSSLLKNDLYSHARQELEVDFRGVRHEVDLKRRELERVVAAIAEIEFTRERKTAEFHRMQANLMELLREQKMELDSVKEKGVQLEVRAPAWVPVKRECCVNHGQDCGESQTMAETPTEKEKVKGGRR